MTQIMLMAMTAVMALLVVVGVMVMTKMHDRIERLTSRMTSLEHQRAYEREFQNRLHQHRAAVMLNENELEQRFLFETTAVHRRVSAALEAFYEKTGGA